MNTENFISTEQISKYHPDKVCDQISDAILTAYLKEDKNARVACETMAKGTTVIIAGEITSTANIDRIAIVKRVMKKLNYPVDNIQDLITTQSAQINNAVSQQKELTAGDQGIMYGYAVEGPNFLPYGFNLANNIIKLIEWDTENNPNSPFAGDAKTQITSKGRFPKEILISTCFKPGAISSIKEGNDYLDNLIVNEYREELNIPYILPELIFNPSGLWTFGGPAADCGLTGRKIVCDSYGGYAPVGGGAFSGKDPSKVDRSGAYIARKIACDMVADGYQECNVSLSYGIGLSQPRAVNVTASYKNIFGKTKTINLNSKIKNKYDLTPEGIIKQLDLLNRDYEEIASGCHMIYFM